MDLIKGLVTGAKDAAGRATDSVGRVAGSIAEAIPTATELKQGLGQALILGGRTLMDPRAVVGELAVDFGRKLAAVEVENAWLVLEATQAGLVVLSRGTEEAARELPGAAAAEGRPVMLCKVMDAQSSGSEPPRVSTD